MKFSARLLPLFALLGMTCWANTAAARTGVAEIKAACAPGIDPQPAGSTWSGGLNPAFGQLTPPALAGAHVISAGEARCIIDRFKTDITVLSVLDDEKIVPGSIPLPWAAQASETDGMQARVLQVAAAATGGDKTKPIIAYCHHERCFMSYNVAMRLVRGGYTAVYWMRTGLTEWTRAAYPLVSRRDPQLVNVRGRATAEFARVLPQCRSQAPAQDLKLIERYVRYFVLDESRVNAGESTAQRRSSMIDPRAEWLKRESGKQSASEYCMNQQFQSMQRGATLPPAFQAEFNAAIVSARPGWEAAHAKNEAQTRRIPDMVEANPKTYLMPTSRANMLDPLKLSATLQTVQGMRRVDSQCAKVYDKEPTAFFTKAEYDRRMALAVKRVSCIKQWTIDVPANDLPGAQDFALAVNWVVRTRPYICTIRAAAGCIPDADWKRVAAIATEANANALAEIYQTSTPLRRAFFLRAEESRLGEWVARPGYMKDGQFVPRR